MSDTALNAMKRTALVLFCLLLLAALGLAFTRVVAARVPEQRATLEKLITDRTGLAVRFENVHFAWGLDGTSAVFTRVELTDPKAGRVRVVAPELRVEFDTWDFLRHQQFSLGHVTLSSPDIEIIGDADEVVASSPAVRKHATASAPANDEAALVRRVAAWAQLMPNGRIEVEGARVHLLQRGQSFRDQAVARRSFTLSQAVISRGANNFSAYGTMLLAQDVGQSLFVSAKLDGLSPTSRASGELRVIARRVFLDKLSLLPLEGLRGRGTLDAKIALRDGLVESGTWQASARDLAIDGDAGPRFDHLTVSGKLSRAAGDLLVELSDLQLTRGARLERAPLLSARLSLEAGGIHIARTRVEAERMPFMAGELVAAVLAPQLAAALPAAPGGWTATAGELHDLRFDSGDRRRNPDAWTFSARMNGAELTRSVDHARVAQLAAHLHLDARELTLDFDPHSVASVHMGSTAEPRPFALGGRMTIAHASDTSAFRFEELTLQSDAATLAANGSWDPANTKPLSLSITNLDRALLGDTWRLSQGAQAEPALLAELTSAQIVDGTLTLAPVPDGGGALEIDWRNSRGALKFASLATAGKDAARIGDARGTLAFARGATQLWLTAGQVEDLTLSAARVDWPAQGTPRLTASLSGPLASPVLRQTLAAQGLEKLTGSVAFDAEARGADALSQPETWRITARLDGAAVPLAKGLPPLENLSGTLRVADGQLRALSLDGKWLGGSVAIESRRVSRGQLSLAMNGTADAAPLLRLFGEGAITRRVAGQLTWNGSALRSSVSAPWQLSLASNLVGLESDLPEPFDKLKARALPLTAELRLDADGVRNFVVDGNDFAIRGEMEATATRVHFALPGVEGDLKRGADAGAGAEITIDRLETKRAPAALAAAAALLPPQGELALNVADLRHADRSLGAMRGAISRTEAGLSFSFDSADNALHRISARGTCASVENRCRANFTADTAHLAALLRGVTLPPELPAERLHASGELAWPLASADLTTALEGHFDLETEGADASHQLVANATLASGQIQLANVQGTGPAADQVFRGTGRVGLVARDYDLSVDYERMVVAAAAVPTPARAKLSRAWNALRGSAARRGWTEAPEAHRVQWHGSWD
jgi:hypothetical protein